MCWSKQFRHGWERDDWSVEESCPLGWALVPPDRGRSEYEAQVYRRINERPIEYRFVFGAIRQTAPESVLDVGTGESALPSLIRTCGPVVTAIDNIRDYWPEGMVNRHFHAKLRTPQKPFLEPAT
jgi:hypothetical protein